ncbi:MAG: sulfate transporter family protein [Pseudomonadota bacterium]
MLASAARALQTATRPRFRGAVLRSVGISIGLFVAIWFALDATAAHIFDRWAPGASSVWAWAETGVSWVLGAGLLIAGGFILAPVTALFAGFFLDGLADDIESNARPAGPVGKPLPMATSIAMSIRFLGLVLLVNLVCLMLVILPGINFVIFFIANGYLLGREYFEFVARRHVSEDQVRTLRSRHGGAIFLGGLMTAGLLSLPLVGLLAPFLATAMMVHYFRNLQLTGQLSSGPPPL